MRVLGEQQDRETYTGYVRYLLIPESGPGPVSSAYLPQGYKVNNFDPVQDWWEAYPNRSMVKARLPSPQVTGSIPGLRKAVFGSFPMVTKDIHYLYAIP